MTEHRRDALALAAWIAFLVVALAGLHALGGGPLSAPPRAGIGGWLADRDAATAAFSLLRLALLATGWYLLVSTLLATVLRISRADAAARAVEACTPAPIRRMVRAAAGLSIAASLLAVSTAAASETDEPVTMRRLPDAVMEVVVDDDDVTTVTMTRLADEGDPPAPPSATPSQGTWTVAAGDHLWSIAERTLAAAWQAEPTDAQVDPYWRELVEHNRSRLPDPRNADLIVPGLVLEVPVPPVR